MGLREMQLKGSGVDKWPAEAFPHDAELNPLFRGLSVPFRHICQKIKGGECAGEEPSASMASPEPLILSKKGGGEWGSRIFR